LNTAVGYFKELSMSKKDNKSTRLPKPQTAGQIEQFIGLVDYFHDYGTPFNDNETTSRHDKKLSEENARKSLTYGQRRKQAFSGL
jgi:hypothetical protein